MKKNLIILLVMVQSLALLSQDFYSTLSYKESETTVRESFSFNENNYVLTTQMNATVPVTFDAIIAEILETGEIITRKNLGNVRLGWNTVIEDNGQLVIAGQTDTTVWLKILDTELVEIEAREYILANTKGNFFTKKLLAFEDSYIVAGDSDGSAGEESTLMFKLRKSDLEEVKRTTAAVVQWPIDLNDVEVYNNDSLIQLVASPIDNPAEKYIRFEIKDEELKTSRTIQTNVLSFRSEFELINGDQIAFKTFPAGIQCINMLGDSLWSYQIADLFDGLNVINGGIEELHKDQNDDLIVCGHLNRFDDEGESFLTSYILKVSKFGDIIWKRSVTPTAGGNTLNAVLESIISFEDCYLFTGQSNNYPVAGEPNYAWALKTNLDGCLEGDDCPEDLLIAVHSPEENTSSLFKIINTKVENIMHFEVLVHESLQCYIYSIDGKQVMSLSGLSKGKTSIAMDVESGMYLFVARNKKGFIQRQKIWVD